MTVENFTSQQGAAVVDAVIQVIQDNTAYLSEIDGAIGDGDHGVNMNKGATQARVKLDAMEEYNISSGFKVVCDVMLDDIGGSMGPLYGSFFRQMFRGSKGKDVVDIEVFNDMLNKALNSIKDIGNAKAGDKTLLDTLEPAVFAFSAAKDSGKSFVEALEAMKAAAEKGKESTIDLVAKVGRASRLGERSRGVLDAGATSCCLILTAMADTIIAFDS
jgi:dihydroxyacetone kinase-like protein